MAAPAGRCLILVALSATLAGCTSDPQPILANDNEIDDPPLRLPAYFEYGMTVVESNASVVVLRNRGTPGYAVTPLTGATLGTNGDNSIAFNLPKQFPLVVNASIAWQNDADLDMALARGQATEPSIICRGQANQTIASDYGKEFCAVRLAPMENDEVWHVLQWTRNNVYRELWFEWNVVVAIDPMG